MFAKGTRLSRTDFKAASASRSKKMSSGHFTVAVPAEGTGYAVVVSKKTARLSVTRHRIKRRTTALLRSLTLPPALIVFPKASSLDVSYADLKEELAGLLSRI